MALQKMGCGEHLDAIIKKKKKKVSVIDQKMKSSTHHNVNPFLPACAELEFSFTISYVPHKQSSLGQALDWTNLEMQTIWEVQDGTGTNCANGYLKLLTFSHTDETVNVIL